MRLNLLRSGWLQFNVHYYDRIKFKYGYDDEASVQALAQLTEIAVESVPREVESFMFLNQLKFNAEALKNQVQQLPLLKMQEFMDAKTHRLIEDAEREGVPREKVMQMIDLRQLVEWNLDTVKRINEKDAGVSSAGGESMVGKIEEKNK